MALFDIVWNGSLVVSRMEAETASEALAKASDLRLAHLMSVHESFLDVARAMKPWRDGAYTAMPAPVPGERIEIERIARFERISQPFTVVSWSECDAVLRCVETGWERHATRTERGDLRFEDGDCGVFKVLRVIPAAKIEPQA